MTQDNFDAIVHHARTIEHYEHPQYQPLAHHDFIIYNSSRHTLAQLEKLLVETPEVIPNVPK